MLVKPLRSLDTWTAELPDFAPALVWAPDGHALAVATLAGPVILLDGESGTQLAVDEGHAGGALALAWSSDGAWLASGGQDGHVRLFDATGRCQAELECGKGWVTHVGWSPSSDCVAAAAGKLLRIWSRSGELLTEVSGYDSTITSLFWLPGSDQLVTSCYGGLQFITVGKTDWVRRLDWKGSILVAKPSPDGRFIATGNQDATVHVWETKSGKDLQMTGYPFKVRELAWCNERPLLATGGAPTITVWSFSGKGPAGKAPDQLKGHEERVTDLAFVSGTTRLVSVGEDRALRVWQRASTWKCIRSAQAETPLHSLAVACGGKRVAAAGAEGRVTAWTI
jgi:WD40 repeat protein